GFTLERDAFRLRLQSGVLQLLTPVAGRAWGAVFSGRGSVELRPATESERRYVAFLANEKTLEVLSDTFTSAVLFFSDATAAEIEKAGSPAASAASDAMDALQTLSKKQRRDWHTNLQLRVLADALRPDRPGRLFVATFVAKKRGPALAVCDPEGPEGLLAGGGSETSALAILEDSAPRLWYCSRSRGGSGAAVPAPSRPARALHYTVDTTIRRNAEIEATTTIRWEALSDGVRVLPLPLP